MTTPYLQTKTEITTILLLTLKNAQAQNYRNLFRVPVDNAPSHKGKIKLKLLLLVLENI